MRRIAAVLILALSFPLPGTAQPPPVQGQSVNATVDINGNLIPISRNGHPLNLPAATQLNSVGLQTTLNGKQPLDSDLTAIATLSTTSFGRSFLTLVDAAASRTYIGAGTSSFSGLFTGLDFTSSNLTSIATRNFSSLQNIPTTLVGYGITDAASTTDPRILSTPVVVFEGDSITDPTYGSAAGNNGWAYKLMQSSSYWRSATSYNVATSGENTAQILAEYTAQIHPHAPAAGQDAYLFVLAGINDYLQAVSAATSYANLKAEWAAARADGFKVVACIVIPRGAAGGGSNEPLNILIRSDTTQYDYLIDFGPDLLIAGAAGTAPNYADITHPSAAGYTIMAKTAARIMAGNDWPGANLRVTDAAIRSSLNFTPSSTGWYRIFASSNDIAGRMVIASDVTSQDRWDIDFNVGQFGGPAVFQQRSGLAGHNFFPAITQIRGGYLSDTAFIDVFVNIANAPITIWFEATNYDLYGAMIPAGIQSPPAAASGGVVQTTLTLVTGTFTTSAPIKATGLTLSLEPSDTSIIFGSGTHGNASEIYGHSAYLVLNSKLGATPIYINFDNNDPGSTVNIFAGNAIVTQPGALTLASFLRANGGYKSSDGTAGATATTAGATFKNGLYTGGSISAGSGDMLAANNLSDLANKSTARQNLGTYFSKHVAKSANFSVASTDGGTVFDVTTGANPITVTLDTATNLGTNFQCLIRKVDSGAGTVTANSQQIGKLNHWIEVDSDGTTIRSKTIQGGFDGSGNYTLSSAGNITLSPGAGSTLGSNWIWNGGVIANSYLATTLSSKTLDDTNSYTAKDGSFTLENTTTVSKKAVFDLSNISTSTTRTVNVPDANSTTAQAKSAVSNQFLTAMSAQGVFTSAQPAIANLSDAGTLATWAGTTPASGVMTFLGTPSSANLATAVTDETGTGKLVFATSPSITTGINDANGNSMLAFTATASAVDGFTFTNAATANPATVTMAATGTDTNISLALTPKGTGGIKIPGGTNTAKGIQLSSSVTTGYYILSNSFMGFGTAAFPKLGAISDGGGVSYFSFDSHTRIGIGSGDAEGAPDVTWSRSSSGVWDALSGNGAGWASIRSGVRDGGTTTVTNGLTIGHQSTGTPAAGLGSGILFNINSSTTADQNAAQIAALWTDATHATRTSDVTVSTVNSAAALAESFRVKATGGISWNGGAVFKKVLTATATLDFPSTAAGVSNDLTITVTGAALGDVVSIGVPDGSTATHSDYSAWVSATDTVKVRFLNGGATLDPASGTFRAQVNQF